mgnify:CR=1 FL=1
MLRRGGLVGLLVSTDVIRSYVRRVVEKEVSRRSPYIIRTNMEGARLEVERILSIKRLPPGVRVYVRLHRRKGNMYEVYVRFETLNRFFSYSDTVHGLDQAFKALRKGIEKCREKIYEAK